METFDLTKFNKTKSAPRFSRGLNGKVDQHQLISLIDLQLLMHKSGFDWIGKLSDLIHLLLCDAPSGFQQRKHTPDKLKMHEKRLWPSTVISTKLVLHLTRIIYFHTTVNDELVQDIPFGKLCSSSHDVIIACIILVLGDQLLNFVL